MIYLDHNATTPLLPSVRDAIWPFLGDYFGNASSVHPHGVAARRAVQVARRQVAEFIGAVPSEVVFTSSGTESVNLAFRCALTGNTRRVIVGATEHACVREAADVARSLGRGVEVVGVDESGAIDLAQLATLLADGPAFVSLIWVNNETGVITNVDAVVDLCRHHGALVHLDAVQAITRVDVNVARTRCDYLSLSAHKFHAPQGVGALFVRSSAPRSPLIPGVQEGGVRGGTENVAGIVGAGAALACQTDWRSEADRQRDLRDRLEQAITVEIPGSIVNGSGAARVANTSNVMLPGRDSAQMVELLGRLGVSVSAGAACSNGGQPSHVLRAMGRSSRWAGSSLRFSLGRSTTAAAVDDAVAHVVRAYHSLLATR